jgi:predicted transcriptional regulator of viral defense system
MRLPRIYDHFSKGQVFTVDEARNALSISGNTLRKRLCELSARGYIRPVRQGLYSLSHPAESTEVTHMSPYVLASKITPWCYVGFSSALQFHAGETPREGETVHVVSQRKFNSFEFEGREYFWCQSPDTWGLETHAMKEGQWTIDVRITDFEKTILDCVKRPMHSPSFSDLVRLCLASRKRPSVDKLFQYAVEADVSAVFNRLGYFLETMQSHWDISAEALVPFHKRISRRLTDWNVGEMPAGWEYAEERWRVQFGKMTLDNPVADC